MERAEEGPAIRDLRVRAEQGDERARLMLEMMLAAGSREAGAEAVKERARRKAGIAKDVAQVSLVGALIGGFMGFGQLVSPVDTDCNGKEMRSGDVCISYGGDHQSSRTYEEAAAESRRARTAWADGPPPSALVGYGLISLSGACFVYYIRCNRAYKRL